MRDYTEVLMKPASGDCNIRCKYCFYSDVQDNRQIASYGKMKTQVLEAIVTKTIENSSKGIFFSFQGGEPMVAGLDFYKELKDLEEKYNVNNLEIRHTIQTNGTLIDRDWARFFKENKYLVGISLDGDQLVHDRYRVDVEGKGTHDQVMKAIDLLKEEEVEFNILTVVTEEMAYKAKEMYSFYKENNLMYQQYVPCITPFSGDGANLTAKGYGQFLKDMFDCWYEDIKNGVFTYNRYFEGLVGIIKGYSPESCGMLGQCMNHYITEADGTVYPCDFYMVDQLKLGNFLTDDFDHFDQMRIKERFVHISTAISKDCGQCKWLYLCRGGCRRDRDMGDLGNIGHNRYCEGFKDFFQYAYQRLNSF